MQKKLKLPKKSVFKGAIGITILLFVTAVSFAQIDNDLEKAERIKRLSELKKSFSNGKSYYLNLVDTTKFVQVEKHYDARTKSNYWFAEVDSVNVGVLNEDLNWIIEPKYCAIAEFDAERGVASVRDCPFPYSIKQMAYWDSEPVYGKWGLVDTTGNWILKPEYDQAIRLDQEFQVILNNETGIKEPIVNLKAIWKGEYTYLKMFAEKLVILKNNDLTGLRHLDDGWLIDYDYYKLAYIAEQDSNCMLMVPYKLVENIDGERFTIDLSKPFYQVYLNGTLNRYYGPKALFNLLTKANRFSYMNGDAVGLLSDAKTKQIIKNHHAFGAWLTATYWDELFGTSTPWFNGFCTARNISSVFADTIYTNLPADWYPFERVEENDYQFEIEQVAKSTFSVFKHSYSLSYGSRGPAYEHTEFSIKNLQVVNDKVQELQLANCFKTNDLSVLKSWFENSLTADSFTICWDHIEHGEYLWKLKSDSLIIYFPNESIANNYAEFNYSYSKISISKKQMGRSFLNENRRRKQFLKGVN